MLRKRVPRWIGASRRRWDPSAAQPRSFGFACGALTALGRLRAANPGVAAAPRFVPSSPGRADPPRNTARENGSSTLWQFPRTARCHSQSTGVQRQTPRSGVATARFWCAVVSTSGAIAARESRPSTPTARGGSRSARCRCRPGSGTLRPRGRAGRPKARLRDHADGFVEARCRAWSG